MTQQEAVLVLARIHEHAAARLTGRRDEVAHRRFAEETTQKIVASLLESSRAFNAVQQSRVSVDDLVEVLNNVVDKLRRR